CHGGSVPPLIDPSLAAGLLVRKAEFLVRAHPDAAVHDQRKTGVLQPDARAAEHAPHLNRAETREQVADVLAFLVRNGHRAAGQAVASASLNLTDSPQPQDSLTFGFRNTKP